MTIIAVIIVGAYTLPQNVVAGIPFGPAVQEFTKQSVSVVVREIDAMTGGALTRTVNSIKNKAQEELKQDVESTKEDIKDNLKDAAGKAIDQRLDQIIAP